MIRKYEQGDDMELIPDTELARRLNKAAQTLRNDRFLMRGLPYIRLGRKILYDWDEIKQILQKCKIEPGNGK